MHASFNQRNALPKFNNLSTAEWVGICKWTFFLYKNVSVIKKEWLNVNMLKDTEFYEDKIHLLTSVQKEIQDWNFNRSWLRTPRFERLNCFWLLLLYVCAPFVSQLCPGPGCMLAVPGCGARPHPAPRHWTHSWLLSDAVLLRLTWTPASGTRCSVVRLRCRRSLKSKRESNELIGLRNSHFLKAKCNMMEFFKCF